MQTFRKVSISGEFSPRS
jgi:hypothetical protein